MAVEETFNRKSYVGNDATTTFDLATKVFALTDVLVYVKDLTSGVAVLKTVDVDYTIAAISGDLDNGTTVTLPISGDPLTYNDQITLVRDIEETQNLNLEEGGDLPANELEDALDRGVMISQQIADDGGRHITHPITDPVDTTYDAPTSEIRANRVLGYDSYGNVTTLTPVDIGSVAANNASGVEILNTTTEADDVTIEVNGDSKFAVKDLGIDTAQLADGSVTAEKLATELASTAIVDGSVTPAKLSGDSFIQYFTDAVEGNATDTLFAFSFTPPTLTAEAYIVSIDGLIQQPSVAYTMTPTGISFATPPPLFAKIIIVCMYVGG